MPECRINLAHLISYLSEAPKSTRAYEGYNRAEAAAKQSLTAAVPLMMRNAPTKLMKELGYARGYHYNPEYAYVIILTMSSCLRLICNYSHFISHPVTNDYVPDEFKNEVFLRKEGDMSDKVWDGEALCLWEAKENGGQSWPGRQDLPSQARLERLVHTEKRDV